MATIPLNTWVLSLSVPDLSKILDSLQVNTSGSAEVLRDRFLRHCRRTGGEHNVHWEPEDEAFFSRKEIGDAAGGETSLDWDALTGGLPPPPPSRRSTLLPVRSVPGEQAGRDGEEWSQVGRVVTHESAIVSGAGVVVTSVATGITVCGTTSIYGSMVRPTAYSVPSYVPPVPQTARILSPEWRPRLPMSEGPARSSPGIPAVEPAATRGRDIVNIVRRWGVSYSGGGEGSIEEFLTRVEECRELTGLTEAELLRALPLLLSGTALQWYRQNRHLFQSWEQLRFAVRDRFGEALWQRRLKEEARRRTQGPDESAADFFTGLQGILAHFNPPMPPNEVLDLAYENLRPEYRDAIRRSDFVSLQQLVALTRDRERIWEMRTEQRPPPPPEKSILPEFAYRERRVAGRRSAPTTAAVSEAEMTVAAVEPMRPVASGEGVRREQPRRDLSQREQPLREQPRRNESRQESPRRLERPKSSGENRANESIAAMVREMRQQIQNLATEIRKPSERGRSSRRSRSREPPAKPAPVPAPRRTGSPRASGSEGRRTPSSNNSNLACWNCGGRGHRFSECDRSRGRFCYRCGKRGVIAAECPSCQGKGSGGRR